MMTRELERKLAEATEAAKKQKLEFVTLEQLFLSLTETPALVEILEACGVNVQEFKKDLRQHLKGQTPLTQDQIDMYGGYESWTPEFTLACHRLIQRAALQVKSSGRNQVTEATLLVSLFYENDSHALYFLKKQNLTQFDVIQYLSHGMSKNSEGAEASSAEPTAIDGGEKDTAKKTALENYCVNLNEKLKKTNLIL